MMGVMRSWTFGEYVTLTEYRGRYFLNRADDEWGMTGTVESICASTDEDAFALVEERRAQGRFPFGERVADPAGG